MASRTSVVTAGQPLGQGVFLEGVVTPAGDRYIGRDQGPGVGPDDVEEERRPAHGMVTNETVMRGRPFKLP